MRAQAIRLLSGPRARDGLRAFFDEAFQLTAAAQIARDRKRFAQMTRTLGPSMREETLRLLEHNVFEARADFRALLVTRETFVNAELAKLYKVEGVAPEAGFVKLTLPEGPRRGLLGHASFLSGTSGTDHTSPTARGKYIREVLLCEDVPAPPPEVDTNLPPAPKGTFLSVRERLEDHRLDVGCSKCHQFIDSIGLAFERFDLFGEYREREGEQPIDPSGELDGRSFEDPAALGEILSRDERVPVCVARSLFRYATGRAGDARDEADVRALADAFRASGFKLYDAVLALATSDSFLYVP